MSGSRLAEMESDVHQEARLIAAMRSKVSTAGYDTLLREATQDVEERRARQQPQADVDWSGSRMHALHPSLIFHSKPGETEGKI